MATLLKDQFKEYIDLDFSFSKHPITNNVSIKKRANAVKQSVINLMQLNVGDKPFHPEIKSPLYGFLFETGSPLLQVIIQDEVKLYLSIYEPRVEIIAVVVKFPRVNEMTCNIIGNIIELQEEFIVNILIDRLR